MRVLSFLPGLLILITFLLAAYYNVPPTNSERTYASFRKFLDQHESSSPVHKHVAIGYNTNVDLIINGLDLMRHLNISSARSGNKSALNSMQDLVDTFLYYFEKGSAAERTITDEHVCQRIVKIAEELEVKQYYIGGNAALMAEAISEYSHVLLAGNLPDNLKKWMPSNVRFLKDALPPTVGEIHLIMEYKKNEQWEGVMTPRSNRFIVHCDETNSKLIPLEGFHDALVSYQPNLLILCGLHLLERMDEAFQIQRLSDVLKVSEKTNDKTKIHLEMASVGSFLYLSKMIDILFPHVHSIGLNEQELGSIDYILSGSIEDPTLNNYITQHFKDPQVETALKAIQRIYTHQNKASKLERIHFHSYKFHILSYKLDGSFKNGTIAAIRASMIASLKACDMKQIDNFEKFEVTWMENNPDSSPENPITIVHKDNIEYIAVPVINCKLPKKTVGLGDFISSEGLMFHDVHR